MSISKAEEEAILAQDIHRMTIWKKKKLEIETRQRGWMKRFGADIDDSIVREEKKTFDERRAERIHATGWRNMTIKPPEPPQTIGLLITSDIPNHSYDRNNLCLLCFGIGSYHFHI